MSVVWSATQAPLIKHEPAATGWVQTPLVVQVSTVHAMLSLHAVATLPGVQAQPSFGTPLQFASSPVVAQESSAAALTSPTQVPQTWLVHVCVPVLQFPTLEPQARVAPFTQLQPPLGVPSQLASFPAVLQSSAAAGATAPVHAVQAPVAWQVCWPA